MTLMLSVLGRAGISQNTPVIQHHGDMYLILVRQPFRLTNGHLKFW